MELAEGVFVISLIASPCITRGSALIRTDSVIVRPLELFPLVMDVLIVTRVFLLRFWVYIFRGWPRRLMFLRQDFRLLFDYDLVCRLVEGVLDRPWFVEGYPLSEFRLVPERLSERVNGHFVAYPADPGHHQLKPADELTEGFVFPLGQTPEIDIGSFSIYEHRVLLEKFLCELSETPDRVSLKACEPLERRSFQVLDK